MKLQPLIELLEHLPPRAQENVAREIIACALAEMGRDPVVDDAVQFGVNAYVHGLRRPRP